MNRSHPSFARLAPLLALTALSLGLALGPNPASAQASSNTAAQALYEEAVDYFAGRKGKPKDERQALPLFESAAAAGHAGAMFRLGEYHREGLAGLSKSDSSALSWYRRSAAGGDAYAITKLAEFHAAGRGGLDRNRAEAEALFERARSLQGPVLASVKDAAKWLEPKEPIEAFGWYAYGIVAAARLSNESLGARRGDSMVQTVYAKVLTAQDSTQATPYDALLLRGLQATRARDGNKVDPKVLTLLAVLEMDGRGGGSRDSLEIGRLLTAAAMRGSADAAYVFAHALEFGSLGEPPNPVSAMNLYRRAAEGWHQSLFRAQIAGALARHHHSGEAGVPHDEALVRLWLQRAAAFDPEAAAALSRLESTLPVSETECRFQGSYTARSAGNGATSGSLNYRATMQVVGEHMAILLMPPDGSSVVMNARQLPTGIEGKGNIQSQDGSLRSYTFQFDRSTGLMALSASMLKPPPDDPSASYRYSARGSCGPARPLRR